MGEMDGSTFGGPLKVIKGLDGSTREVLGIPIGPFSETNIAVSQAENPFGLGTNALTDIIMQYGGWILGISVFTSANFTASPPTFTVQKNGVDTAISFTMATGTTEGQSPEVTRYEDAVRFERGDNLRLVYDTGAGTLPAGSVDVEAFIWIG